MQSKYAASLFDTEDGTCWHCKAITDTNRHEIFRGVNRQNSKRQGLWICLCPRCHRLFHTRDYEIEMCRIGQTKYLSTGKTQDEFMEIFGRNYL